MRIQKLNPPVEVELLAVRSRARVIYNSLAQAVIFFYLLLLIFSIVLFCFHFVLVVDILLNNVPIRIIVYIFTLISSALLALELIEQTRFSRKEKGAHERSCELFSWLSVVLLCSQDDPIFYEVRPLIKILLNGDPLWRLILLLLSLLINVLIDRILLIEPIRLTQKEISVQIPSFRCNYVLYFVIPMLPRETQKVLSSSHFYRGSRFRLVLYYFSILLHCFSLFLHYFSFVLYCSLEHNSIFNPMGFKPLIGFYQSEVQPLIEIPLTGDPHWRLLFLLLALYAHSKIECIRFTWEKKSVRIRAFGCDYVLNFVILTAAWEAQKARSDYMHDSNKFEPQESPKGKFRRSINSWQKGGLLGSGSFGTVYEGFTDDGFFFAVKEVSNFHRQGSIDQLEQEIFLLSQFEHDNIVQYLGTDKDKDKDKLYIFLELVTKGSLESLYKKYPLQDSQVSSYTRQIVNGLKYLHDRNVVHRDIKCANILIHATGNVKLADFGLAKVAELQDIKSCKGTPFWMAPEVVNSKNNGYGLAADIWSLGCTVLEMLTRCRPFSDLEDMQALFRIGKGKRPPVPNSLSRDARDFIFKCLKVNPNNRPSAAQLLEHPFVKRPLQILFGPTSPHYNDTPS